MGISVIGGSSGGASKIQKTEIITSTQAWVAPADVSRVDVELSGGGGGGARGTIVHSGGAGSYNFNSFAVTPGTSYTITIGAGGNGATVNGSGGNGTASSFGALFTVAGGGGGTPFNTSVPTPGGRGGKPHTLFATAQSLTVEVAPHGSLLGGAGGTGAANGYGVNASLGSNGGGNGAWDTAISATAAQANSGAGGGGGGNQTNGANGGSGICIIKYWSAL